MTSTDPDDQEVGGVTKATLPAGTLRIAQITDTHLYADTERRLLGLNTLDCLRQVIGLVQATAWPIDMVLATGDLVHDASPAGYELASREFANLHVPVYALPGNHDIPAVMLDSLSSNGMTMPGVVDTAHWRLVMLDSVIPNAEGGHLSDHELAHLEQALSQQDKHTLVCLHHQPLPVGSRWIDTMALDNGDAFFDILARHPQVRGVLWGHIHQEYDQTRNGLRLLASPSTCVQFSHAADDFRVDEKPPGCRLLALLPDGSIHTEVLRLERYPNGIDLDSGGY